MWVCDIQKDLLKKLYHGPAKPKFGGVSGLARSFDEQHIAIFFPSDILVLEIENPAHVRRIRGKELSWVSNHRVIYSRGNKVATGWIPEKPILFSKMPPRRYFLLLHEKCGESTKTNKRDKIILASITSPKGAARSFLFSIPSPPPCLERKLKEVGNERMQRMPAQSKQTGFFMSPMRSAVSGQGEMGRVGV